MITDSFRNVTILENPLIMVNVYVNVYGKNKTEQQGNRYERLSTSEILASVKNMIWPT